MTINGAEAGAAHARDEQSDEDEEHHGRAGFVLVAEHAAPAAGEFGLEQIGAPGGSTAREQQNAEIAESSTNSTTAASTSAKCRMFFGTSSTMPAMPMVTSVKASRRADSAGSQEVTTESANQTSVTIKTGRTSSNKPLWLMSEAPTPRPATNNSE